MRHGTRARAAVLGAVTTTDAAEQLSSTASTAIFASNRISAIFRQADDWVTWCGGVVSDRVVGGLVLAGIMMVVVAAVLTGGAGRRLRSSPAAARTAAPGWSCPASWRGHASAIVGSWLCAVGVTVLGLSYVDTYAVFAAVVVGGAGLLLLFLVWAGTSGRGGDGTLTCHRSVCTSAGAAPTSSYPGMR